MLLSNGRNPLESLKDLKEAVLTLPKFNGSRSHSMSCSHELEKKSDCDIAFQTYHCKLDYVTSLNLWIRTVKFSNNLKALKFDNNK